MFTQDFLQDVNVTISYATEKQDDPSRLVHMYKLLVLTTGAPSKEVHKNCLSEGLC